MFVLNLKQCNHNVAIMKPWLDIAKDFSIFFQFLKDFII